MTEKVADYEASDLEERHKVALRLADAVITYPAGIDAALREEVERHFTREQILELVLDVLKWSTQKLQVALRIDREVTGGALTDLRFDERGHVVWPP